MFGLSGIWEHPTSTIPALLAGVGGIVVAFGWMDADTWAKNATMVGSILVAIIGILYKGKEV